MLGEQDYQGTLYQQVNASAPCFHDDVSLMPYKAQLLLSNGRA